MKSFMIFLLSMAMSVGCAAQNNTTAVWQTDLSFIVEKIEEFHPNPWLRIPRETFLGNANQMVNDLDHLTEEQRIVKTMQLVALLGDGHTYLFPWTHPLIYRWFPVRMERFDDGVFITGIDKKYEEYVGTEIIRIGCLSADSCFNMVGSVTSSDSPILLQRTVPSLICNATILYGLGIAEDSDMLDLIVRTKSGNNVPVQIKAVRFGTDGGWTDDKSAVWGSDDPVTIFDRMEDGIPLSLEKNRSSGANYWFKDLKEEKAIYFQYNRCFNGEEPFKEFNRRMWSVYEADPLAYDKLIVDLRYNGGGDGTLHKDFLLEVIQHPEINKRNHLFVITGRETFSAGSKLVAEMITYTNAITVGEPSGPVNWFSDTEQLVVPSGKMGTIQISKMYWQYGHPLDQKGFYAPEFPVPVKSKDYIEGRDLALEMILNNEVRTLKDVLLEEGFEAFINEYKNRAGKFSEHSWWFPYDEFDLRLMGVNLLTDGRRDDATGLFTFLTDRYPDISWGWQILGNLYAGQGDYGKGLHCYEKAFSVNPDCFYTQKDGRNIAENCYKDSLVSAFRHEGTESIKNLYCNLKANSHWNVFDRLLITVANDFIKTEELNDAVKILQLNTELNPDSPDAFLGLGKALFLQGNKKQAARFLEKSLQLDPGNSEAMELLRKPGTR